LFFRNEAFQKIDGFDTNIFLYWEEMDLCHRLRKNGYSAVLVPQAVILHYQGVSIGHSEIIDKEAYISYLYVLQKNYSFIKYIWIRKYLILVILLKPKKWFLLSVLLKLNPSKVSLKHLQQPTYFDEN
jgi:GT2 family glycosyltransferase